MYRNERCCAQDESAATRTHLFVFSSVKGEYDGSFTNIMKSFSDGVHAKKMDFCVWCMKKAIIISV